jgi:hypothetical protein
MNCLSTWSYSGNICILWSKCVRESFFYCSQLLTELLEDKQIAKLGGSWYVQNVYTFPNTFAIVSPLICVFWIQLTRTKAIFSRIALVSCFLCRNSTFRKNLGKYSKIPILPEDPRSQKTRRRGAGRQAHHQGARPRPGRARGWWDHPSRLLEPPFRLHIPFNLKLSGVQHFSQIDFRCAATTIRNRDSEPETLFWHPAGTGIWRRSLSPSSPTSLHQPYMTLPSMCE